MPDVFAASMDAPLTRAPKPKAQSLKPKASTYKSSLYMNVVGSSPGVSDPRA
jgi:hypothetical protein